ncbi:metallopeptidase TldD-related protein [bacterium]|nr:hypothetical protein [bacterium]MCG2677443.1 metallopeptidase TldD-related protein [bacterium]
MVERLIKGFVLVIALVIFSSGIIQAAELNESNQIIFKAMETELNRSMKKLKIEKDKPYFIAYTIVDRNYIFMEATLGKFTEDDARHYREGYAMVKVGDYQYDNSIFRKKRKGRREWGLRTRISIPLEDDLIIMRHKLWLLTDSQFKDAVNQFTRKKETEELQVKREEIADFSKVKPVEYYEETKKIDIDKKAWAERLKRLSLIFKGHPEIEKSKVSLQIWVEIRYLLNSEGTKIKDHNIGYKVDVNASTISQDEMPIASSYTFYGHKGDDLPDEMELKEEIEKMIEDINKRLNSEVIDGYLGPVLVEAPASGFLFLKLIGKNILGNREDYENSELLFYNRLNRKMTNRSISVYADPTIQYYNGVPVSDYYLYDAEGVKARKVNVIENGIFKNYLMTRTPIKGFEESNGYAYPTSRAKVEPGVSNLFVETKDKMSYEQLKEKLIILCKEQNLPYGLIIRRFDIDREIPTSAVKIDVNTGEETPVFGFDAVSVSDLTILDKIIALADDEKVCNTYQGSCVAPSILIEELEFKENKDLFKKPPLIDSPLK